MSCAVATLKFLAYIFNILCCIFAALTLSANAYALAIYDANAVIRIPCILGIVLSSLLFLTTILGCFAILRESARLILLYSIIVLLLLGAQVAAFFLMAIDYNELADQTISNAWNGELTHSGSMTEYELQYDCCGKTGPIDYVDNGMNVPATCYNNQNSTNIDDLYTEGCVEKLAAAFGYGETVDLISDWTLVSIEGATVIIACMLAISLRNNERRKMFH